MDKVRIAAFSVSVDGYGAGPAQDLEHPLGLRGEELHNWFFGTEVFSQIHGKPGGVRNIDNDFALRSFENVGAWIIGRNMFGPLRGPWKDHSWRGWWGENPPYHTPVFVLTHHARPALPMEGGTTFHFITDGIERALSAARAAAGRKDVRVGGGVSVLRQYLTAGLIDEMHLALSPVSLGAGENLLQGIDLADCGLRRVQLVPGVAVMHVILSRS
jgi:dihydrofolate reductase